MTNEEQALLNNAAIFYNKQQLTLKVEQLLERTANELATKLHSPDARIENLLAARNFKISRGENYKALPWQIVDFPRIAGSENLFATRTLCWWGQCFSFNLLLLGKVWETMRPAFLQRLGAEHGPDILMSTGNDPWEQDLNSPVFKPLAACTAQDVPVHFLRLTKQHPLNDWQTIPEKAVEVYGEMLKLLET